MLKKFLGNSLARMFYKLDMASTNISTNFSNGSSSKDNVLCDIFDDSVPVKLTKILVFSFILSSSLVGNTLIIIIVYKREELRKTTNYFIVNMAVSDFIFPLQAIPVSLAQLTLGSLHWPIGGTAGLILCKLGSYLRRLSGTVSAESLIWIAVDRFMAVVLPMKVHLISSKFRAFAIASTWIVAMIINSVDLYAFKVVGKNHEVLCTYSNDTAFILLYGKVRLALFQIAPLIAMTVLYCVIVVTLRRQNKALQCSAENQIAPRKKQAIKMSLCIMIAFYICVLPMSLLSVTLEYGMEMPCPFKKVLVSLGYVMYYLSSTINPIICMTLVKSYRRSLTEIINLLWSKCVTVNAVAACEHEEITLQEIRVIPEVDRRDSLHC